MIVNNIQPCLKRCLPMPLARVGSNTDSTTYIYSYNARQGLFLCTRDGAHIGIVCIMHRGFCTLVLFILLCFFKGFICFLAHTCLPDSPVVVGILYCQTQVNMAMSMAFVDFLSMIKAFRPPERVGMWSNYPYNTTPTDK